MKKFNKKYLWFLLPVMLACVGAFAGYAGPSFSAYFGPYTTNFIPKVIGYVSGLPIYGDSKLQDTGTQLLYNGSPVGGGGGTPGGNSGQTQINNSGAFAGISLTQIPYGGQLATIGDSLCNGTDLPNFVSPGFPTGTLGTGNWPSLLGAAINALGFGITTTVHCTSGQTLGGMISAYPTYTHSISPTVTGTPGILYFSIYGNDASAGNICPSGCTYTIASYNAAIDAFVTNTLVPDGWKVGFLAQWAQGSSRQASDQYRLAVNDHMKADVANGTTSFYLDFTGYMNNPNNATYYSTGDEQHPNALSSQMIAAKALKDLMTTGVTENWGKFANEDSLQPIPISVLAGTSAIGLSTVDLTNFSTAGFTGLRLFDATYTHRADIGCGNSAYAIPTSSYTSTCWENWNIGYSGSVFYTWAMNGTPVWSVTLGKGMNIIQPLNANSSLAATIAVTTGSCVVGTPAFSGGWAGQFGVTTGGACTFTITPNGTTNIATGYTGPLPRDITTGSVLFTEGTPATPRQQYTFTGTVITGDTIKYGPLVAY